MRNNDHRYGKAGTWETLHPMVRCGAIVSPMHRHRYTQHDNTVIRVWLKVYEDGMMMKRRIHHLLLPSQVG